MEEPYFICAAWHIWKTHKLSVRKPCRHNGYLFQMIWPRKPWITTCNLHLCEKKRDPVLWCRPQKYPINLLITMYWGISIFASGLYPLMYRLLLLLLRNAAVPPPLPTGWRSRLWRLPECDVCVLRNLISRPSLEINLLHLISPKRDRKAVADNLVYIWSVFLYRYKKTIGQKENYWYKRKRDQNRLSWLGAPKGWNFHFLASPKSSFWTGFIRLFDMAGCHLRFIYKSNAFWSFRCISLRFWLQDD